MWNSVELSLRFHKILFPIVNIYIFQWMKKWFFLCRKWKSGSPTGADLLAYKWPFAAAFWYRWPSGTDLLI